MPRAGGLSTRVGRRVLALFLTCALVPVLISVAVFYGWVESALTESRKSRLDQMVQSYQTVLLERLSIADQAISDADAGHRDLVERLTEDSYRRMFRSIVIRSASGESSRTILGAGEHAPSSPTDPEIQTHLQSGRSALITADHEGSSQHLWIVRRIASTGSIVLAQVSPDFVWGTSDDLSYGTLVCVFGQTSVPLYCSDALIGSLGDQLREFGGQRPGGQFTWQNAAGRHLASYRELFMQSTYRAEAWNVVISQPESLTVATGRAVARIFVPAIVLGLLIAVLLGLVHVRRTMRPLAELTGAARRLTAHEFRTRVQVRGADEFGELASAFNEMSERLGRQFHALRVLAEIDGVILSKISVDRIVSIVLERMAELVPADGRYLLLADAGDPGRFTLHAPEQTGGRSTFGVVEMGIDLRQQVLAARDGMTLGADRPLSALWRWPCFAGAQQGFVIPIVLNDALAGMIALSFDTAPALETEHIGLLQSLGDRIAVALGTARRHDELYRSANFDPLTRLPNRRLFMAELPRELARAEREGTRVGVLFIDLDGFSSVNDSLGHAVGDELLMHTAARLRMCLRKSDLIARLGGDEFAVAVIDLASPEQAAGIAQHIIDALAKPFDLANHTAFVGASIGIAIFPGDGLSAETLLQQADMAMYRAKSNGRAGYSFFEPDMNQAAQERMSLNVDLRRALERSEFVLHYQPQLDLATNRIVGAEALIRWQHPTRGLLTPAPFIGVAEETGLIEQIGEWVMRDACTQFMAWQRDGLILQHISVNVSPRQFRHRSFPDLVARIVAETGIPSAALHLEITESVLVDNQATVADILEALVALGVHLELDDFGTGYSSLAYLQRLPVSTIKLDRSFISDIEASENARAVVSAAVEMVHALEKQIVVEGVETAAQIALLRSWRCDAIQGYFLGRPVPAGQFSAQAPAKVHEGLAGTGGRPGKLATV